MSTLRVNAVTNLSDEAQFMPVLRTAQASTSGTFIDFTAIPSWVNRITVTFAGVSTTGTSPLLVQLGTGSTAYTTSGYSGQANNVGALLAMSTGFTVSSNVVAAQTLNGLVSICRVSSLAWVESGTVMNNSGTSNGTYSGGSVTLSAALTAVRVTTVNGTDAFDAGTINIMYE